MNYVSRALFETLALVITYALTGFGPGFILGLLVANRLAGRNKELFMDASAKEIQKAQKLNEQWKPSHKRWQHHSAPK